MIDTTPKNLPITQGVGHETPPRETPAREQEAAPLSAARAAEILARHPHLKNVAAVLPVVAAFDQTLSRHEQTSPDGR